MLYYDNLSAAKAKKDGAIFTLKSDEGEDAGASVPYLGSTISIADYLESVKGKKLAKKLANEIFSDNVLENLGVSRSKGTLSV